MSENTERDELFQLMLGRTTTKAVERILAAGYGKPRIITTAEDLDALPSGSVILDSSGEANVLHDNGWVLPGGPGGYTTWAVAQSLPVTVLHEPEAS